MNEQYIQILLWLGGRRSKYYDTFLYSNLFSLDAIALLIGKKLVRMIKKDGVKYFRLTERGEKLYTVIINLADSF